jgi:hypothetical protein
MRKIVTIRPVPHTEDLPVPVPPQQDILDSDDKPTENWKKIGRGVVYIQSGLGWSCVHSECINSKYF